MDEREKMARMNAWVDSLCEAYSLSRDEAGAVIPGMLQMSHDVAHGPARPGVPVTAFLLGFVAGRSGKDIPEAADEVLSQLQPLLDPYRNADGVIE